MQGKFQFGSLELRMKDNIRWMRTAWKILLQNDNDVGTAAPVRKLTYTTNDPVPFSVNKAWHAAMLTGGNGKAGHPVELDDGVIDVGRGSTLLTGDLSKYDENVRAALSVALGDVMRPFAEWSGRTLTYYGGPYRGLSGQLLFFSGHPRFDMQIFQREFRMVFIACQKKLMTLLPAEAEQARNAIAIYLDGRSARVFGPIKLMAAFHLLEFFVRPRKLHWESLAGTLEITPNLARSFVRLRNDVIHNNGSIEESARSFFCAPAVTSSTMYQAMRPFDVEHTEFDALNYVMSCCDRALLRWVGYCGLVQHYFPTDEEDLRRCYPSS